MRKSKSLFWSCLLLTALILEPRAACPLWVKKDQVITGSRANAPAGWYAYARSNTSGLCKSSMSAFNQQIVPNTQSDQPVAIDISYDGQWIVYLTSTNTSIYMIKPDGTQKKQVPVSGTSWGYPRGTGFYQNGPNGLEVFYLASPQKVRSIPVNVSTGIPQFGTPRDLVDLSNGANGLAMDNGGWVGSTHMNAGHFISQGMDNIGPKPPRRFILFITLANGGRNTATASNIWQFNDLPDTSIFGCGATISPDGSMVLYNPGSQGNPSCIPNRESGLDHKGFVVVPFYEASMPTMSRNEFIDDHGISANFCPTSYRWGLHNEVDFTGWKFTGNARYVIGLLGGELETTPGAWLVDWQTNTWTELTSGAVPVVEVAGFVPPDVGVKRPYIASRLSGVKPAPVEVYNLRGQSLNRTTSGVRHWQGGHSPRVLVGKNSGNWRYFVD